MKTGLKVFRIAGIDIRLHYSWWLIFILLAWSLSTTYFPQPEVFPGAVKSTYWVMGIIASLLLFISVLLHELSHSLVAKFRKIKVESITLFFFGGVAGITKEKIKPSSEFMMAIAGPIFSLVLAGVFYLIFIIGINGAAAAIAKYLALLNLILACFNLVPAYPLDGGRAFRAILYAYYKDLKKATRIASFGGKIFAIYMIMEGLFNLFGAVIIFPGGLWFLILGVFLFIIAKGSYEQVVVDEALEQIKIRDLVQKKYPILNSEQTVSSFLKQYQNSGEESFIIEGNNFLGVLDINNINPLGKKINSIAKLKLLAVPLTKNSFISEHDSAEKVFGIFMQTNSDILPVLAREVSSNSQNKQSKNRSEIIGIVRKRDLLTRLKYALKFKIGELKGSQVNTINNKKLRVEKMK